MKTTTLALAAALAAFGATAAHAENRFSVAIGVTPAPVYTQSPAYYPPAPVVVPTAPVYAPGYAPAYGPAYDGRGHWENVSVRTWVPERWVMARDMWGRPYRTVEPGHFVYSTNRVWVDHRRDEPGYGYGYGRRDDDWRRDRDHDRWDRDGDHDRR